MQFSKKLITILFVQTLGLSLNAQSHPTIQQKYYAPEPGSGSSGGDGPCYDKCKDQYDACKKANPGMSCYDLYCACLSACDAQN